jgi:hypothetical protein
MFYRALDKVGKTGTNLLAIVLWLATAALGGFDIYVVHEMAARVYARYFGSGVARGSNYWESIALGNVIVLVLAVLWIGLVIGGGEYHAKYVGTRKSWRLFARTLGVELAVLVLALFI